MTREQVLDYVTEFQQEKCVSKLQLIYLKKKSKIEPMRLKVIENMHLMRAKDMMFMKTGVDSVDVDHNIVNLDLNEDIEFNAISKK
jgi:hypothetical protein